MKRTIVLAVDSTSAAQRAVALLAGYRGDPSALHVVVTTAQARPLKLWPEPVIDACALEEALLSDARNTAASAAATLRASGFSAESAPLLGSADDAIVHEASLRGADLILMGTRGDGVLGGYALGSIALRVVHASAVPVCLVRSQSRLPEELGRRLKVLLAVDGSGPALRAARTLIAWRPWLGDPDVQLVHVQTPLTYLETVLPPHDDVVGQWSAQASESATREAREFFERDGIHNLTHIRMGNLAEQIVQLALDERCDLVAMGARGLGAAHHAFVGSVALSVAARAAAPTLLVK